MPSSHRSLDSTLFAATSYDIPKTQPIASILRLQPTRITHLTHRLSNPVLRLSFLHRALRSPILFNPIPYCSLDLPRVLTLRLQQRYYHPHPLGPPLTSHLSPFTSTSPRRSSPIRYSVSAHINTVLRLPLLSILGFETQAWCFAFDHDNSTSPTHSTPSRWVTAKASPSTSMAKVCHFSSVSSTLFSPLLGRQPKTLLLSCLPRVSCMARHSAVRAGTPAIEDCICAT